MEISFMKKLIILMLEMIFVISVISQNYVPPVRLCQKGVIPRLTRNPIKIDTDY